jgi:hypothetical protein
MVQRRLPLLLALEHTEEEKAAAAATKVHELPGVLDVPVDGEEVHGSLSPNR